MPDQEHLNVMIDPFDVDAAVREDPAACQELRWGKEVKGVHVSLGDADRRMVEALLEAAWRRKAPNRLVR
jgi:hypothetical protein